MKEAPHVEFSPWLKRLGFVVFGVLCAPGIVAVTWFNDKPSGSEVYLMVVGISGAIGLFVHALTHLALTPLALYLHFRRAEGQPPLRAAWSTLSGVGQTVAVGAISLVAAIFVAGAIRFVLGKEVSDWVVLAIAVVGAVGYDIQRRRVRTIDLSKSRGLTLK